MTVQRDSSGGLRRAARKLGLSLRNSTLLVRALSGIPAGGCVILRYHSVNSDPGWAGDYVQGSLVVAPEVFDRQIEFLTRRHRIVSVGEVADALRDGRSTGHGSVAVTFDDGYEDNYRFALPILRRHGATATFYVTTGAISDRDLLWPVAVRNAVRRSERSKLDLTFTRQREVDLSTPGAREAAVRLISGAIKSLSAIDARAAAAETLEACGAHAHVSDRRVMMNEDEIRAVRDAGMTVGAHTVNHFNLPSLGPSDVESEVGDSKDSLEAILGEEVKDFAYPDGRTGRHCDARIARAVADHGYRSAVTSVSGATSGRHSPYGIPRLGVYTRHASISRFAADIQHAKFRRSADGVLNEIHSSMPRPSARDRRSKSA